MLSVHLPVVACGSASCLHAVLMGEVFQGHEAPTGLGCAMSWFRPQQQLPFAQASAGCWGGQREPQGSGQGSVKVLALQGTNLTGSHGQLHCCLSLSVPSCLLTPAPNDLTFR